ncbi:MAG: penicillin acylase family protein [Myxococcota bacterium]
MNVERIGLGVAGVALAAAGLAAGGVAWRVRAPWPVTDGALEVPGLHGPVTVWRDARGVPSIAAGDAHDLLFAQGFVHAQDRLWQMQLGRMFGRGELAAAFGAAAVPADTMVWTLGLPIAAERSEAALDPDTRAALAAYAEGVNAYLAGDPVLPVEFAALGVTPDPWRVTDSLLVGEAIGMALGRNASVEAMRLRAAAALGPEAVARLMPDYPSRYPVVVASVPAEPSAAPWLAELDQPGAGSNGWVVAGSRTASGRPLLANDTHLGLSVPSVWYENALYGGPYAVTGFSLPGAPFVAIGHNDRVAWGMTSLVADTQDLFLQRVDDPVNPTRVEVAGQWVPIELERHTVAVKGAEPVEVVVRLTGDGPLANGVVWASGDLPPFALRSDVRGGSTLFRALRTLDLASDWSSFAGALGWWDRPGVNFVYADTDGNIGYHAAGRIPIRPEGDTGRWPVEGWTGTHGWVGYVPAAELPHTLNPASGFVVTANNRVVGDDYPYTITHDWGDPFRASRLTEVLSGAHGLTADDMAALQRDTFSVQADELLPYALAVPADGPLAAAAHDALARWDRRFEADSVGALVYTVWSWKLVPAILGDELGDSLVTDLDFTIRIQTDLTALLGRPDDPFFDDVHTPERESRDAVTARAFTEAVAWLGQNLGDDPAGWTWGRAHRVGFQHQPLGQTGVGPVDALFNPPALPVPGDSFSPDANGWDGARPFQVAFGPASRFVADLGDLARSRSATPLGQSGHLLHPHREDQLEAWTEAESFPMPYGREAARAAAAETLTLTPEVTP